MRRLALWFYFVAAMQGVAQGQAPEIRQVGPFEQFADCQRARSAENPALWRSEYCVSEVDTAVPVFPWGIRP